MGTDAMWNRIASRLGFGAATKAPAASARAAKERLQVMIASKRLHDNADLAHLQRELLAVVERHFSVKHADINVTVRKDGGLDVFELQVPLPETDGARESVEEIPISIRVAH